MRERIQDSAEKQRLVKEWDKSGLSAAAFAEPRGIHPETLRSWGRSIRGPVRRGSRMRAVPREVELVEIQKDETGGVRVELELGNGRRMVVFGELTTEMIVELAAAMDAGEAR